MTGFQVCVVVALALIFVTLTGINANLRELVAFYQSWAKKEEEASGKH